MLWLSDICIHICMYTSLIHKHFFFACCKAAEDGTPLQAIRHAPVGCIHQWILLPISRRNLFIAFPAFPSERKPISSAYVIRERSYVPESLKERKEEKEKDVTSIKRTTQGGIGFCGF